MKNKLYRFFGIYPALILIAIIINPSVAQPVKSIDLIGLPTTSGLQRVFGSVGSGTAGVPVAGGFDMDGDGYKDYAFAAMQADPFSRNSAGQVFLVFGDGLIQGTVDTSSPSPRVLEIYGDQIQENAGSEIWMADVTGDNLGDLIICRQNFSPPGKIGAGAMTIIPGQAALKTRAANNQHVDLRTPPASLNILTLLGANAGDRLCIWARNGDVTGDGIDEIAVGADREKSNGENDAGAVYVIRGGNHLLGPATVDLANFGTTALPGNLARVKPPINSIDFHFGATVQLADLDGNNKAELLAAAALNRAGASLPPSGGSGNGSGGSPQGTVYIAWDDNFNGTWMPAPDFVANAGTGASSVIDGGAIHDAFGEEMLGGLDYDNDGKADLFIGDLTADGLNGISRPNAGTGHVFYDAENLKNQVFDFDTPPAGVNIASFLGPFAGAIGGDTAMHGDLNGDGIADLAFSSPHDEPFGRTSAGTMHVILGRNSQWPANSDLELASFPTPAQVGIINIYGALGSQPGDVGDTLSYSGAAGDLNNDGVTDIITNEMVGNGTTPTSVDTGNLILLDGKKLFQTPTPETQSTPGIICFDVMTDTGGHGVVCF